MTWLIVWFTAYLLGSIPFALLLTRWIAGVDLRTVGSGNLGATNASRVIGSKWGGVVLLLDFLKGAISVVLGWWLFQGDEVWISHAGVLGGVGAILGHMYPVYLGFRGGKGVATAFGAAMALAPLAMLLALLVFGVVFAISRIVSLGSLCSAISFAIVQLTMLWPQPFSGRMWSLALFSLVIPTLIIVRHSKNIARLLSGTEPRWIPKSQREAATAAAPAESPVPTTDALPVDPSPVTKTPA